MANGSTPSVKVPRVEIGFEEGEGCERDPDILKQEIGIMKVKCRLLKLAK